MSILWALAVILVVMWFLGLSVFSIGGGLIHLLIVLAVIVLLYNLFVSRRSTGL